MTNEERDLIAQFVQRVGGRAAGTGGFAGSVPAVGSAPLPPVDPEADALLADLFAKYPEARYRITQVAFVQERASAAAASQIAQLQAQLQAQAQQMQQMQAQQTPAPAQSSPWGNAGATPQAQPAPSRGLFGGLFGGGQQAAPPQYQQPAYAPPAPQYAPQQPGMFQRSGSGFLGSALTTAAGVAGGMMAANALEGLFSGHQNQQNASFGGMGGGFAPQQSFPGEAAPWSNQTQQGSDPLDQGGDAKSFPDAAPDQSGWASAPAPADSGWQDSPAPADSGWTDSGGGGSDFDTNT